MDRRYSGVVRKQTRADRLFTPPCPSCQLTTTFCILTLQPPECTEELGDCGSWVAIPYFISFFLLVGVLMMRLFMAVIIEAFDKGQEQVTGVR